MLFSFHLEGALQLVSLSFNTSLAAAHSTLPLSPSSSPSSLCPSFMLKNESEKERPRERETERERESLRGGSWRSGSGFGRPRRRWQALVTWRRQTRGGEEQTKEKVVGCALCGSPRKKKGGRGREARPMARSASQRVKLSLTRSLASSLAFIYNSASGQEPNQPTNPQPGAVTVWLRPRAVSPVATARAVLL